MLGRFIVAATRVHELLEQIRERAAFPVSVILDAHGDARAWLQHAGSMLASLADLRAVEPRLAIGSLELALPKLQAMRETYDAAIGQFAAMRAQHGFGDVPAYVEIPRDERWIAQLPGAIAALARHRLGAKLRCGGLTADAFPSVGEVTAFMRIANDDNVAFKATAGLHHPLRHLDAATGATQHGFVNLLCGALLATLEPADVTEGAIAEEYPSAFTFGTEAFSWREYKFAAADIVQMRAKQFVAYGSCSFAEPVDDLIVLGVLGAGA